MPRIGSRVDSDGRAMAACREIVAGACRAPLASLSATAATGAFQLELHGFDGEGRPTQIRHVDGSATVLTRRADGRVVRARRVAGPGSDPQFLTMPLPDDVWFVGTPLLAGRVDGGSAEERWTWDAAHGSGGMGVRAAHVRARASA